MDNLIEITDKIKNAEVLTEPILSKEQIEHIDDLEDWTEKFQSPLQLLEHRLHNWVAYFVIPVFALANAGVAIDSNVALDMALVGNIIIALVLGKSIGISAVVLFAKKTKLAAIPKDVSNRHIIGVSFLAGIGFTMAIFIGNLALGDTPPAYIDSAKIGILIGSLISATIGYFILAWKRR